MATVEAEVAGDPVTGKLWIQRSVRKLAQELAHCGLSLDGFAATPQFSLDRPLVRQKAPVRQSPQTGIFSQALSQVGEGLRRGRIGHLRPSHLLCGAEESLELVAGGAEAETAAHLLPQFPSFFEARGEGEGLVVAGGIVDGQTQSHASPGGSRTPPGGPTG